MKHIKDGYLYSAIKEIINIGGGNAATSLSTLINKRVHMDVPTLKLMEYQDVYQTILADDKEVKVVMMQLLGGEGSFLFVVSPDDAHKLAEQMFQNEMDITEELADSAVKELVNTLVNSFLNASMKIIGLEPIASVPILIHDLFGSVLSTIYLEHRQFDSTIVIMQNEFWSEGDKIDGSHFFIPTPEFMQKLVERIQEQGRV